MPANLVPTVGGNVNYVALRDAATDGPPLCGATGRQDNRGYEGLAISPGRQDACMPCSRIR